MSVTTLLIILVVLCLLNYGGGQVAPAWGTSPFHNYGYGGVLLLVLILYLIFR
jgi:hypothetical protein